MNDQLYESRAKPHEPWQYTREGETKGKREIPAGILPRDNQADDSGVLGGRQAKGARRDEVACSAQGNVLTWIFGRAIVSQGARDRGRKAKIGREMGSEVRPKCFPTPAGSQTLISLGARGDERVIGKVEVT